MSTNRGLILFIGLICTGLCGTASAGNWQAAPIDDLDGMLNARTELKSSASMELGSRHRDAGHPAAYGEMEVVCEGRSSARDRWCNVQLEVIFAKKVRGERVRIDILDDGGRVLNTAFLLDETTDNVRARVYVVGAPYGGDNPTVRVSITGDREKISSNARVTFLRAAREKEDKTNWQVASNRTLTDEQGVPLKRPTFLIGL
jgi:hypothetical protein